VIELAIESVKNGIKFIFDYLDNHQLIISVIGFGVGILCPMLGITGTVITVMSRTLTAINIIVFLKNNYATILEWAKERPYRFAVALTVAVPTALLLRRWTRKASNTNATNGKASNTNATNGKASNKNNANASTPRANVFDKRNRSFGAGFKW
jgi:hypothetical protein